MSRRDGGEGVLRTVPVVTSVVVGAVAFVLGYALMLGLLIVDGVLADGDGGSTGNGAGSGGETPAQFLEFLGALFYNAHFVDAVAESTQGTSSTNLVSDIDLFLPDVAYQAVPVVLLALGGFVVARRVRDRLQSPEGAAVVGASIVLAYLPLVVFGTQVFNFGGTVSTAFGEFQYTIETPLRQSIVLAGIVYPTVLGALGGLAYYLLRGR